MPSRRQTLRHLFGGGWASDYGPAAEVQIREDGVVILPFLVNAEDLFFEFDGGPHKIGGATKQRLAALKAQGKKLGRKPASAAQIRRVRRLRAEGLSLREIAKNASISYGAVSNIISGNGAYAS